MASPKSNDKAPAKHLYLVAVLAQPWADVVLSGAATADQLRANAKVLAVQLDAEAVRSLAALREPAEEYWRTRGRLSWN